MFILAVSAKSTYTEALRLKTLKRSTALAVRFTLWMYDPDYTKTSKLEQVVDNVF